jgi:hypothetical protein
VQLFGPGVKKPGDVVQEQTNFVSASAGTSGGTFVALTGETVAVTPQNAAHPIRVEAFGQALFANPGTSGIRLSRGTVANTNLFGNAGGLARSDTTSTGGTTVPTSLVGYDLPNVITAVTYAVQGFSGNGTMTYGGNTQLVAREIMI